jgi:hypothetical protein
MPTSSQQKDQIKPIKQQVFQDVFHRFDALLTGQYGSINLSSISSAHQTLWQPASRLTARLTVTRSIRNPLI